VKRNVGVFKDRSDSYRELLPAPVALMQAFAPVCFRSFLLVELCGLCDYAAMRTHRTAGPKELFQVFACCVVMLKVLLVKPRHVLIVRREASFFKCIIRERFACRKPRNIEYKAVGLKAEQRGYFFPFGTNG